MPWCAGAAWLIWLGCICMLAGLGLLSRGIGLIYGRFRVDPHKNYLAVSMDVFVLRALLFGVYNGAP